MPINKSELIIVDTNILFSQDKREVFNHEFRDFFDTYAKEFNLKLKIPAVVKGELKYQITDHLFDQMTKANDAVRVLTSTTGKNYAHRISQERIKKDIDKKFQSLIKKYKADILPIPFKYIKLKDLADKAIWRKPPFTESVKKEEKGFRDALILETIIHYSDNLTNNQSISFICNDKVLRESAESEVQNVNFNAYESILDYKSTLDLKKEKLERILINKITKRAREKFFKSGNNESLYNRDNLRSKIYEKYKNYIYDPKLSINPLRELIVSSLTEVLEPTSKETFWISRPTFDRVENQKEYYWVSVVTYVRTYRVATTPANTSNSADIEKIHILPFRIAWKSEVARDGRFLEYEYLDINLEDAEFRTITEVDKNKWNLD